MNRAIAIVVAGCVLAVSALVRGQDCQVGSAFVVITPPSFGSCSIVAVPDPLGVKYDVSLIATGEGQNDMVEFRVDGGGIPPALVPDVVPIAG